jgi:predicted dehydrogenase
VTAPLRVALHGADGRMGRAILRAMVDTKGFNLVAAIDRNATARGADAGERAGVGHIGVQLTGEMAAVASADVVIDFSHRLRRRATAARGGHDGAHAGDDRRARRAREEDAHGRGAEHQHRRDRALPPRQGGDAPAR